MEAESGAAAPAIFTKKRYLKNDDNDDFCVNIFFLFAALHFSQIPDIYVIFFINFCVRHFKS